MCVPCSGAAQAAFFTVVLYTLATQLDAFFAAQQTPGQYTARNISLAVRTVVQVCGMGNLLPGHPLDFASSGRRAPESLTPWPNEGRHHAVTMYADSAGPSLAGTNLPADVPLRCKHRWPDRPRRPAGLLPGHGCGRSAAARQRACGFAKGEHLGVHTVTRISVNAVVCMPSMVHQLIHLQVGCAIKLGVNPVL